MPASAPHSATALIKHAYGEQPEDVISPIKATADALFWLDELLAMILELSASDTPHSRTRIKVLAEVGRHVAGDIGNYADSVYENMATRLQKSGTLPAATISVGAHA